MPESLEVEDDGRTMQIYYDAKDVYQAAGVLDSSKPLVPQYEELRRRIRFLQQSITKHVARIRRRERRKREIH